MRPLPAPPPHVAIIMDGNGRWATARGRSRALGHAAGARAVRRTVEAARAIGIRTLTLYAFSSDNWKRPGGEVDALMRLFADYLASEVDRCVQNGVRLSVIGRRDRLGAALVAAIEAAERATRDSDALDLRIAIDYSARDAIVLAAALPSTGVPTRGEFAERLASATHAPAAPPDVDLLIRTGGERRLSDFLLWECAYAELVFTDRAWPDFGRRDLEVAIEEFRARDRRFGALPSPVRARSA